MTLNEEKKTIHYGKHLICITKTHYLTHYYVNDNFHSLIFFYQELGEKIETES